MQIKFFAVALAACVSISSFAEGASRPNIVLLVADDWGFTDVGAFGSEIATPNIDALAKRGVRFSNFHAAASCAPTRSMLLTGVDNHRNGVGNLSEAMPREHKGQPGYQGSLTRNVVTVASLLQDSGYRTYITGKWNVGSEPYNLPNQRGFDRSIIQGDTGSDNWDPQQRYLPHSAKVHWYEDGKEAVMPKEYYSSTYFVDRMLDYLKTDTRKDQPFFAYLGFQANHVPLQAPKAFIEKYRGRYKDGWDALREERRQKAIALGLMPASAAAVRMQTTGEWNALSEKDKLYEQRRMEVYAAMADAMDVEVGRLVAHLKHTGEYDNTVFVFMSDNGPEASDYRDAKGWIWTQYSLDIDRMGGPGAYAIPGPSWASAQAAPLSTYKFYAGEGGIRVPMLIAGVRGSRPQQIQTALTHVTDIAPTLLDLAGVQAPGKRYKDQDVEPIVGKSLLPVLTGKEQSVRAEREVLGYELSGNAAIFKGDLKLVVNLPPVGDGKWHLYDMLKDPGETKDLFSQLPEVVRGMSADFDRYAQQNGVLAMPKDYNPQRQVLINSFFNYWWPTYGMAGVVLLVLLLGYVGYRVVLRIRRKRAA
jgi:arylsulfatase/uncharacterized sulfatase